MKQNQHHPRKGCVFRARRPQSALGTVRHVQCSYSGRIGLNANTGQMQQRMGVLHIANFFVWRKRLAGPMSFLNRDTSWDTRTCMVNIEGQASGRQHCQPSRATCHGSCSAEFQMHVVMGLSMPGFERQLAMGLEVLPFQCRLPGDTNCTRRQLNGKSPFAPRLHK